MFLKGINLEGFKQEDIENLKLPESSIKSDLWEQKIPNSCPKCEEIRGIKNSTLLFSAPNILAWKSFGMCEKCYIFQRDNPEEAEKNKAEFQKKKAEEEKQKTEQLIAHRYRVYILEKNEKIPVTPFASSVTNCKFTRYPTETLKGKATHSIQLLTREEAEKIVQILTEKELVCWYDDSEYQQILKENI